MSDGIGVAAQFNSPNGIAIDKNGALYVADSANHRIRRISTNGEVSTIAGNLAGFRDGDSLVAQFNCPYGVAVDVDLNIYVADTYNHSVRKITPDGTVTRFAGNGVAGFRDGAGTSAQFNLPFSVDVDSVGNVYVADAGNHRVRKISPFGIVTTLAGNGASGKVDGVTSQARFSIPNDIAVDSQKNVYVADFGNHCIRKISFGGIVSTVAGNGVSGASDGFRSAARFDSPTGLAIDAIGNIYVCDNGNNRIRVLTPDGITTTIAGLGLPGASDGRSSQATFAAPTDLIVDNQGRIFVTDTNNHRIRLIY